MLEDTQHKKKQVLRERLTKNTENKRKTRYLSFKRCRPVYISCRAVVKGPRGREVTSSRQLAV